MGTEDGLKDYIKWIISEIKKEALGNDQEYALFKYQNGKDAPSYTDQERLLKFLKKKGALVLGRNEYPKAFSLSFVAERLGVEPTGKYIKINEERLDDIYQEYDYLFDSKNETKSSHSLVKEIFAGPLVYTKDGRVTFKNKELTMRPQIKTLCIFFMKNRNEFLDYSTIKDELIKAEKRSDTPLKTITQYVSELHKILKKAFRKEVIFNDKKEGYIFNIDR